MTSWYLHYEGKLGAPLTTKYFVGGGDLSLDSIVDQFVGQYNAQGASAVLDPLLLDLRYEDGSPVSLTGSDAPGNREDLYLVDCAVKRNRATSASAGAGKPSASSTPSSSSSSSSSPGDVEKKARGLFAKKSYSQARKLCESALKQGSKDPMLSLLLCEILLSTGKHDAAVDYGESACDALQARKGEGAVFKKASLVLSKAYFAAGQFNDAWQKLRELTVSSSSSSRVAGSDAQNVDLDILSLQAECLFASGRHSDAANLINGHMGDAGAEEHMSILIAYSSFALQYGKIPEALRALLKAVTIDNKHKKAKKLLSEILAKDEGFAELVEQLPPSERSAAAYAFLATIVKDHSAIPTCVALFTIALKYRPDCASYALNLVHTIELQHDMDAALEAAKAFLSENRILRAGKSGFTCGELLAALDGSSAPRVLDASVIGEAVLWVEDGQRGYSTTHNIVGSDAGDLARLEPNDQSRTWLTAEKEALDDNALDLLAIGFTLVKINYLKGNLAALPALYRVIEPTRHRSKKAIHETSVRNEHSYYQCIAQILSYRIGCSSAGGKEAAAAPYLADPKTACCNVLSHPAFAEAAKRPLYAVGDSHCLSSAWSVVSVQGQQRLVIPKLVTGVKHWHLRPDSEFYPKFNFKATLATVPEKADVVFIIGEIDCREGILLAVERDKYASIQEGMKHTVSIFTKVLSGLASTKKLQAWIHPVLPMLNETRQLVLAYNSIYREAIDKLSSSKIAWLDFFEDLLIVGSEGSADDVKLRPGLAMDGTHISPAYCQLMEREINARLSSAKK